MLVGPRRLLAAAAALAFVGASCETFDRERRKQEILAHYQETAQRWYDANDLGRAEQVARRALDLYPHDYKSNLIVGYCALKTGRLDAALAALETARKERDDYKVAFGLGWAHLRAANAARPDGDEAFSPEQRAHHLAEAERYFRSTLERVPDWPPALASLGATLGSMETYDEAIGVLRRYVDYARSSREEYESLRGVATTVEENRLLEEKRWGAEMKEVDVRGLVGNYLYKQGRFAEAAAEIDAILELDPARSQEYMNRARCRQRLGLAREALEDLERFLSKTDLPADDPRVREAVRLREELSAAAPPREASASH